MNEAESGGDKESKVLDVPYMGLLYHFVKFRFYFEWNGKLLPSFEEKSEMILYILNNKSFHLLCIYQALDLVMMQY